MDDSKRFLEEEIVKIDAKISELKAIENDPEMAEMIKSEVDTLEKQKQELQKVMEEPTAAEDAEGKQENDFKHVIIEARGGVGGEEAKLWADELLRMYSRYANVKNWKIEILDEGVMRLSGKGVFATLQYETGVHRVQRVPVTEAAGRVHTSTASIVVLPEVPENLIDIKEDDLLWEFTRGGGHGGQNVNKVATAVRLTHKPTGIIVQSRQERFQEQNRKIALALLRSQLWEKEQEKKLASIAGQRAAIGRSMRSEKIRTFNFPQNRVTDHRIGKSWYKLERIIEGDLDDVLEAVRLGLSQDNASGDNQTTDDESGSDGFTQPQVG